MAGTTGYGAGANTINSKLAMAREATWGVIPLTNTYIQMRYMSETLGKTENRQRANEIDGLPSAGDNVLMSVSAGGDVNFGFSQYNFEQLMLSILAPDVEWGDRTKVASISDSLTGASFFSFTLLKDFGNNLIFAYPGSFVTGFSLSIAQGQFATGKATFLSMDEIGDVYSQIQGALPYNAAYSNSRILNTAGDYKGTLLNGAAATSVVDSITLNITRDGAALEYGLGSTAAAGVNPGTLTVSGTVSMFFRDFSFYNMFKAQSTNSLDFTMGPSKNGNQKYDFNLPAVRFTNPKIQAAGKGQPVKATFDFFCERSATTQQTITISTTPTAAS